MESFPIHHLYFCLCWSVNSHVSSLLVAFLVKHGDTAGRTLLLPLSILLSNNRQMIYVHICIRMYLVYTCFTELLVLNGNIHIDKEESVILGKILPIQHSWIRSPQIPSFFPMLFQSSPTHSVCICSFADFSRLWPATVWMQYDCVFPWSQIIIFLVWLRTKQTDVSGFPLHRGQSPPFSYHLTNLLFSVCLRVFAELLFPFFQIRFYC